MPVPDEGSAAAPPGGPVGPDPTTAGIAFHERLRGHWAPAGTDLGDLEQYEQAERSGRRAGAVAALDLDVVGEDVRAVVDRLDVALAVSGSVTLAGLPGDPFTVETGELRLVVADDRVDPQVEHMRYRLRLVGTDGSRYRLDGFKILEPGTLGDAWPDTTTLYATLRSDGPDPDVVGLAIVRVAVSDFVDLLRSMRVTGPVSGPRRRALLVRFGSAFARHLYDDYGAIVQRTTPFDPHAAPRPHRPLDVPKRQQYTYRAADGTVLRLVRYQGGSNGPVVLVHGLGANPLTFSTDTIRPNLVEYLVAREYDVWLQEWRGSTLLPSSRTSFTADDVADQDHPAAEAAIRRITGRQELHWVTHCVGTMTVLMATLRGVITPESILCSQVGHHCVVPPLQQLKVDARLGEALHRSGLRIMTTDSTTDETAGQRLFDRALALYPVPRDERCHSSVCRRLAFIYGVAVHHAAVDEVTHTFLHELFGAANLTMLSQLSACARAGRLVGAGGAARYDGHLERLRLPMTFLHGRRNRVWLPVSTQRSFDDLVRAFGADGFRRIVFDGHGHQDTMMGVSSPTDVFPHILDHLDRARA